MRPTLAAALVLSIGLAGGALAQDGTQEAAPTTSNFHAVGFDIKTNDHDAFTRSILKLADTCEVIKLDEDDLICLEETDQGGQIWIGLRVTDGTAQYVTANPAFVGKSLFPVKVAGVQSDKELEPFEYRLAVTFSDLDIPLLVELADPREAGRFKELAEPVDITLDVTAFTFNPEIFEDEAAFYAAQKKLGEDVSYAADYFIPTGLFGDETSARASFAGEILEAERVQASNGASHWRTLVKVQGGGTVNVVFDDVWPELKPAKGKLISGAFWLSARVVGED